MIIEMLFVIRNRKISVIGKEDFDQFFRQAWAFMTSHFVPWSDGQRSGQAFADRVQRSLGAIRHMQFVQDIADILGDRPLMDDQDGSNLLVTQAARDQAQSLKFTTRQ